MRLREVQIKVFEDVSLAALETAVNTWLQSFSGSDDTASNRQLVSIHYAQSESFDTAGTIRYQSYGCVIVYVE
jgi:hypothetical protein